MYGYIKRNYEALVAEIKEAALAGGCSEVELVAVTKSGTDEELLALAALGVENMQIVAE